jgi:hypothetical protein
MTSKTQRIQEALGARHSLNIRHIKGDVWEYEAPTLGRGTVVRRHMEVTPTAVVLGARFWGVYRQHVASNGHAGAVGFVVVEGPMEFIGWSSDATSVQNMKLQARKPGWVVSATCNWASDPSHK